MRGVSVAVKLLSINAPYKYGDFVEKRKSVNKSKTLCRLFVKMKDVQKAGTRLKFILPFHPVPVPQGRG
jgi:hypothetical protein